MEGASPWPGAPTGADSATSDATRRKTVARFTLDRSPGQ